MNRQFTFALVFTPAELERCYYRERLENIVVTSEQGLRVQLPLRRLAPFITQVGIRGRFLLTLDSNNRFVSLQKINNI